MFSHRATSLIIHINQSAGPAVSVGGNSLQMGFQLLLQWGSVGLWFKGIRLLIIKNITGSRS